MPKKKKKPLGRALPRDGETLALLSIYAPSDLEDLRVWLSKHVPPGTEGLWTPTMEDNI